MAQERYVSPEKQLLKLIENSKSKESGAAGYAIRHRGLSLFSIAAWTGRFSFFRESFAKWGFRSLDIKAVNNILALCVFALAFYFISNFFAATVNLKKPVDFKIEGRDEVKYGSVEEFKGFKKPASYYLENARQRNIFKIGAKGKAKEEAGAAETEAKPGAPSSRIIEVSSNLKLVGISWSSDPDAMIEDAKALRTFFVKKGQMVGELRVEAIFKDKIVLSYDGEEIELK